MFKQGYRDASAIFAGGLVHVSSLTGQEGGLIWMNQAMVAGVPDSTVSISRGEPG